MLPIQWTTEALHVAIRTGIVVAEIQTTMMLRMMGLAGLWMPPASPARVENILSAPAPTAPGAPVRRAVRFP